MNDRKPAPAQPTDIQIKEFMANVVPWPAKMPWLRIDPLESPEEKAVLRALVPGDKAACGSSPTSRIPSRLWFCTSSQKRNNGHRDSENAIGLVCIPIDVDVKPDSRDHYSTLAEAIANLFWACDQLRHSAPFVPGRQRRRFAWLLAVRSHVDRRDVATVRRRTQGRIQEPWPQVRRRLHWRCRTGDADAGYEELEIRPPRPVRLLPLYCNGTKFDFATVFGKLNSEPKAAPRPRNKKQQPAARHQSRGSV